jgi:hypothetical protein
MSSAKNKTIIEKASKLVNELIAKNSETSSSIARQTGGSPRSLALQRNEIEVEYMQEMAQLNSFIQEKKLELERISREDDEKSQRERASLESELLALDEKAAAVKETRFNAAAALDTEIGLKHELEAKEMEQAAAKYKRIVVTLEQEDIKRTLKPVRYFSDLQAQLETYHPGFIVVLSVAGTSQVVGSQFELLCAYQDGGQDELALSLKLVPDSRPQKRRLQEEEDTAEDSNYIRHTGKWTNAEIQLFQDGVEQYGWGEWAKIAGTIETRDREQVRTFSKNQRAKKFKRSASLVSALSDLAEGFKVVARGLDAVDTNDEE